MVSQPEVKEALRKLGGKATSKEIAEQLKKDGIIYYEYKQPNTIGSIVSTTLARCKKWGDVKVEFTVKGYTGRRKLCNPTWVLIKE